MSRAAVLGYVPGAWDLFHIGHLNLLRRARESCDHLVAGVAVDEAIRAVKGRDPLVPFEERLEIVREIAYVDRAVPDLGPDKAIMWQQLHFDVLFKGDDWKGTAQGDRLEATLAAIGVQVVYFPYTRHICSTRLRGQLGATPVREPGALRS